ncbi:MAG TPA: acetylxylan esterase [Candidatus Brocadiia bacterium]|nr:acetylxylan esterase [Candidatus Brocadiia bacterium]
MGITLWQYYKDLSARIARNALAGLTTRQDWEAGRAALKAEFMRSMGLDPMPAKCDLKPTNYGRFSGPGYSARKVAFQLLPDVWGSAIIFSPDPLPTAKAPGVLYCCGHYPIGVLGYQDHAIMWARRGYVCLIFDTIEQHDNPGEHHGLYFGERYDWISMGYSGAGGELWNTIRALDLLASLPEVDPSRLGATGNSGGGAQSFYAAVADDRIKALASSCGVTTHDYTLAHRNVMGHCDCIYNHNPYQRDTSEFAALIAPRPALFCYGIHDGLFNVPEYRAMIDRARRVYALYGCPDALRLFDYPGPHGYQPESVEEINAWFDRHVSGRPHPSVTRQDKPHPDQATTLFNGAPPSPDRLNLLPELLSRTGVLPLPNTPAEWPALRAAAVKNLREQVFHAILRQPPAFAPERIGDWRSGPDPNNRRQEYHAEIEGVETWMCLFNRCDKTDTAVVSVADSDRCCMDALRHISDFVEDHVLAVLEPRGSGFSHCPSRERDLLRAGALTGVTPCMAMIQDLEVMMPFVRQHPFVQGKRIVLHGRGDAAVACLYHALMHEDIAGLALENLPSSHRRGGYILGILRIMDLPHALGLMAPRPVAVVNIGKMSNNHWAKRAYERLGCAGNLLYTAGNVGRALRHATAKP